MQAYLVSGSFRMGESWTRFTNEIAANDEAGAREKIFSIIGSRHRANRREIKIESVKPISGDQITDLVVERLVSGK